MDGYELLAHLTSARQARGTLTLPNVIGVGAPRCGTSWLTEAFMSHPQAWVPPGLTTKELNFFGIRGHPAEPIPVSLAEYSLFFEEGADLPVRAEFSPAYLGHEPSLDHLIETLPAVKVIVQIRDRRERFWSQFKYHRDEHGYDDWTAFVADALDTYRTDVRRDTRWFSPAKIMSHSLYAPGVDHLLTALGRERVLVLDYRQLVANPARYAAAAFEFAGIDANHPVPSGATNQSTGPGVPGLPTDLERRLARLFDADRRRMRDLGYELGSFHRTADMLPKFSAHGG